MKKLADYLVRNAGCIILDNVLTDLLFYYLFFLYDYI